MGGRWQEKRGPAVVGAGGSSTRRKTAVDRRWAEDMAWLSDGWRAALLSASPS